MKRGPKNEGAQLRVTCFVPDQEKPGGKYVTRKGLMKRIDEDSDSIILEGDVTILIRDILLAQEVPHQRLGIWQI